MSDFGLKIKNVYYDKNKHDDSCHNCKSNFGNFFKIIIITYLEENSIYLCHKCIKKLNDKLAKLQS